MSPHDAHLRALRPHDELAAGRWRAMLEQARLVRGGSLRVRGDPLANWMTPRMQSIVVAQQANATQSGWMPATFKEGASLTSNANDGDKNENATEVQSVTIRGR